jgi:molecular chaperone IbpA
LLIIKENKMTRTFAIPRKAFLGFDHIFDELERISTHANDSYPPHNVVKMEEHKYLVELAVAGFARDDLNIE